MRVKLKDRMNYKIQLPCVFAGAQLVQQDWCKEVIGPRHIKWIMEWSRGSNVTYMFMHEKDLMLFTLKWL